MTMFLLIFPIF